MRVMSLFRHKIDQAQRTDRNHLTLIRAAIVAAFLIILSVELYAFARVQDVWTDETTQLSGITLGPWEMLRWLLGADADRFNVPWDRMPPASYLLDWLWLRLAGPSELGFRIFHSAFVVAGVALLAIAAMRQMGVWAAVVILGLSILSPKLILTGVEIRAYPVFFAITCAQLIVFLHITSDPYNLKTKTVVLLAFLCCFAMYTHFYGIVSSYVLFATLILARLRTDRKNIRPIIVAFAIMLIVSIGILPFAFDSVTLTKRITDSAPMTGNELVTVDFFKYLLAVWWFIFALIGSNANIVSRFGLILFAGGALALLSAAAIIAFNQVQNGKPRPFDWLCLVAMAGALTPIIAIGLFKIFHIKIFDPMFPRYSVWLFAPLAILIGSGATSPTGFRPWDCGARFAATGAMLIGAALATHMFFTHASVFEHGPGRFVGGIYDTIPGPKAIVYEGRGHWWLYSYFPLAFNYKDNIAQYRVTEDGTGLIRIGGAGRAQEIESAVTPYKYLLLVEVQTRTPLDIRECLNKTVLCPSFGQSSTESFLTESGRWSATEEQRSLGEFDTQAKVLKRAATRATPTGSE
jgi:hypothetical protein